MQASESKSYGTVILGSGVAGLMAACSLLERGVSDIAVLSPGYGGAPYIAAFNAVLPDGPYGDTPRNYCSDMLAAGHNIGDKALVEALGEHAAESVRLLERWGVSFARQEDGGYKLRRASGSSCPRSLCRTDRLIGGHIVEVLRAGLQKKGVTFLDGASCFSLLVKDGRAAGLTYRGQNGGISLLRAPTLLAAWGGVGNLYKKSTYPADIDGRTLAMTYEAGVSQVDLEFVEFEPMVCLEPTAAVGEPCPTAMLGEGAYLLNSGGERFLLKKRPVGEAGAPKSLINEAIKEEVAAGRGSPLGGVYADLRHLPDAVLRSYPWFYNRLLEAGLDAKTSLLQVGPMAHSHSGGMEIDACCMTNITGLFAAGEAAGGMHGACRMAGNAATQAAGSALMASEGIAGFDRSDIPDLPDLPPYAEDSAIRHNIMPRIREAMSAYVDKYRDAEGLSAALSTLAELRGQASGDTFTEQCALSGILLATAALAREESRGTHNRTDFPEQSEAFNCSIRLKKGAEGVRVERVER